MGFTKKTWKNRIAEYINRRLLTNEDGSTELVTVARDEGTISQEGDAFNAANMNDLEDRIEAGFTEVNQSLTNLKNPAKGANGIFVNSGSPLAKDCLLVYTLQSTDATYSGASIRINDINVAQLTAQNANCKQTIVGSVRAFKGDIITITTSNYGGNASVYAYITDTI
jgi:hypothetical protein